jgi:hypothetical protein
MRFLPPTLALVAIFASPVAAFELLTLDKEAVFYGAASGPGVARIRVGPDRALREHLDPRCPAVTRVRISSYSDYRFGGEPEVELPCERWIAAAGSFVYRDPSASAAGIHTVRFGPGGLSIEAANGGDAPVVGPVGFVHVRF